MNEVHATGGGSIQVGALAQSTGTAIATSGGAAEVPGQVDQPGSGPVHRTVLAVDIAGSNAPHRTGAQLEAMRACMYDTVRNACAEVGIDRQQCYGEDRGDGLFLFMPPEMPKVKIARSLPGELLAELREQNGTRAPEVRIRLRAVLHSAEVRFDEHGVSGPSLNLAFRLLDSAQLKSELATGVGALALMASDSFYDEVVRHCPAAEPGAYRAVPVREKETETAAWVRLL